MRTLIGLFFSLSSLLVLAQTTPQGIWRTIDDETGQAKSLVRIEARDDKLFGTVTQILNPDKKDSTCDKCPGDRLGLPIEGLEILRDMSPDGRYWSGGTILDPKKGKVYKAKMSLNEVGDKLTVRGYIGFSLLGRSQVWQRAQ